jgi:xanthine dehydrogenase YagS FAD-binding subunit
MKANDAAPEIAIKLAINGAARDHGGCAHISPRPAARGRVSYEFALVSAAVALHVDGSIIRSARVAAGGVGTIPWRLSGAEDALVGEPVGERAWKAAADRAVGGAQPLTHNAFKVELLKRTVSRALAQVGGAE